MTASFGPSVHRALVVPRGCDGAGVFAAIVISFFLFLFLFLRHRHRSFSHTTPSFSKPAYCMFQSLPVFGTGQHETYAVVVIAVTASSPLSVPQDFCQQSFLISTRSQHQVVESCHSSLHAPNSQLDARFCSGFIFFFIIIMSHAAVDMGFISI